MFWYIYNIYKLHYISTQCIYVCVHHGGLVFSLGCLASSSQVKRRLLFISRCDLGVYVSSRRASCSGWSLSLARGMHWRIYTNTYQSCGWMRWSWIYLTKRVVEEIMVDCVKMMMWQCNTKFPLSSCARRLLDRLTVQLWSHTLQSKVDFDRDLLESKPTGWLVAGRVCFHASDVQADEVLLMTSF